MITSSEVYYPEWVMLTELRENLQKQTDDAKWRYPRERTRREYQVRQTLGALSELMHQLDTLVELLPAYDRWPDGAPT